MASVLGAHLLVSSCRTRNIFLLSPLHFSNSSHLLSWKLFLSSTTLLVTVEFKNDHSFLFLSVLAFLLFSASCRVVCEIHGYFLFFFLGIWFLASDKTTSFMSSQSLFGVLSSSACRSCWKRFLTSIVKAKGIFCTSYLVGGASDFLAFSLNFIFAKSSWWSLPQ